MNDDLMDDDGDAEAYRREIENPQEYLASHHQRGRNQIPRRLLQQKDWVGYRRPPIAHQWKPGQSGNPHGRPKGARNIQTEIVKFFVRQIIIHEGGKTRKASGLEALVLKLTEMAFKGDHKAIQTLLKLAPTEMLSDPTERLIMRNFSALSDEELLVMQKLINKIASSSS